MWLPVSIIDKMSYSSGSQNVVPRPEALTSTGNLLKFLVPTQDPLNQNSGDGTQETLLTSTLGQCFSKVSVHQNHVAGLLKHRLLEFIARVLTGFPGLQKAANPWTIL